MGKGSKRRKEDIKKIWNKWDNINWSKKPDNSKTKRLKHEK